MPISKEEVLKSLEALPDDATIEDMLDRVYVLYEIEQGLADVEAGRVISHEEVIQRMAELSRELAER